MTQPMNSTQPNNTTHSPSLIAGKDVKDFQLTAPMVDVRGWNVVGPTGQQIGTVDRIMLDRTEQKTRYLSVALPKTTEYLLLPIGLGSVDTTQKRITLDSLEPETLQALPVLKSKEVDADFEQRVFSALKGKQDKAVPASERYADPVFDPMKLFGSTPTSLKS